MPDEFPYDVFLRHSAKDKAVASRFQIGTLKRRLDLAHPPCLRLDMPIWHFKSTPAVGGVSNRHALKVTQ